MTAYKIVSGKPTAKWVAASAGGAGVGLPLGVVVAYLVNYGFPTMPAEVQVAVVAVIMWACTQGSMMLAGYLKRPSKDDRPVVDPATLPKRPAEPLS